MNETSNSPVFPKSMLSPLARTTAIPFWYQLRWQLLLVFVLLAVLPVVIVMAVMLPRLSEHARDQVAQRLQAVVMLKKERVESWLEESIFVLGIPLADPAKKYRFATFATSSLAQTRDASFDLNQKIVNKMLEGVLSSQTVFEEYFIYNTKGEVVAGTNSARVGKSVSQAPYFVDSLSETFFVQVPYYGAGQGDLTMMITHPLLNIETDEVTGVLAGRLNLQVLRQLMAENIGVDDPVETYLVSPTENYMVTPGRFANYPLARGTSEGISRALQGQSGWGVYDNYAQPGVPVLGVYNWVPGIEVGILAEIEEARAMESFTRARNLSLGVAIAAGLAAMLAGLYSTVRVSWPIATLTRAATRLSSGDLDQKVEIGGRNEISLLAGAFNSMTIQLRGLVGSLEEQVSARTRRLELVAALSEELNAILKLEELLEAVVHRIQDNFGYYHAHIYLLDEEKQNLVVAAGTGRAGLEMKQQRHSIRLDAPASLVARAARTGEIVRVDNVRQEKDWLPNLLLPDTYAEMAVPILLDKETLGVLDVQQDRIGGLDEGDAGLLRSLANQVAITIRNARIFADAERALAEAQEAQQQYMAQAWDKLRLSRHTTSRVQFSLGETTTLNESAIIQARRHAIAQKGPVTVTMNGQKTSGGAGGTEHVLVAPITLRDVPIGNLQLHGLSSQREWSEGELALVEAVVDQVAQAAETLRLLNETQERASREQFIGQVTDKLRRAPDMEALVKIAVTELSRALGPARTFARLGPPSALGLTPKNGSEHKE